MKKQSEKIGKQKLYSENRGEKMERKRKENYWVRSEEGEWKDKEIGLKEIEK